jgi:hypothetical protein
MPSWLAQLLGLVGVAALGGMIGRELRRRFAPKMAVHEMDEVQAEQQQERWVSEKRVRVVPARRKPEWLRRWERRMAGLGRLGERINNSGAKR